MLRDPDDLSTRAAWCPTCEELTPQVFDYVEGTVEDGLWGMDIWWTCRVCGELVRQRL